MTPKSSFKQTDSVYVTYNFWSQNNTHFTITLHNESSSPIYVDWNKSRIFVNQSERRYWVDVVEKSTSRGSAILLPVYGIILTEGNSITRRPEKISFVVPKSSVTITWNRFPKFNYQLANQKVVMENCSYCTKEGKLKKTYVRELTPDHTVLTFRNYISYSFSEDFAQELRFDDYWWANRVVTMSHRQYVGKSSYNQYDEMVFEYPYRTNHSYCVRK